MDFKVLSGKTILIISPQSWDYLKVSKHHYAIELSKRNKVYFLNPNSPKVPRGSCKLAEVTKEGVHVLDYRPVFPMRYKFKYNRLFNYSIKWDIRNILKVIGGAPDIVWDFEPNRQFSDLELFGAKLKIYHPVDVTPHIYCKAKNADIIFSVSQLILDLFQDEFVPKVFINHGLNSMYVSRVTEGRLSKVIKTSLDVGYIGNLRMAFIDHEIFMKIILKNPKVNFHLWGPYEEDIKNDDSTNFKINFFVKRLKELQNVILYGIKPSEEILKELHKIDLFFWCFNNHIDPNKGSNSHKILEYLSTGKAVVSSKILSYSSEVYKDLIIMPEEGESFDECFERVISNLGYYNNLHLYTMRVNLALENSYTNHIKKIDNILFDLVDKKYLHLKAKDN